MLQRRLVRVFFGYIAVIVVLGLIAAPIIVGAMNSSQVSFPSSGIIFSQPLPTADYYILENSGTYYAIDANTQQNFLDGTNAATVINTVLQGMTGGGKITIQGNIILSESIKPQSNTYLDLSEASIHASSSAIRAIYIDDEHDITVDGGHFYGFDGTNGLERAIKSYFSDRITITNCIFENIGSGIAVECQNGVGNIIKENTFLYSPRSYAVVFNDCSNGLITRNNIDSGLNGAGIGIFSTSESESDCEISFNTITGWGPTVLWHAIYISGTPNTVIHSNIMGNPSAVTCGAAMLIKSLFTNIYNNTVNSTPNWGLHIYQETGQNYNSPNGTIVHNNTFIGSPNGGIYITPEDGYSVSDIEITSNSFSSMNVPIWTKGSAMDSMLINTLIQDNTFYDSTYGVRIGSYGGPSYVDGVEVINNVFTSIGSYPAILFESETTNGVIAYNTFTSCTTNIQDDGLDTEIYGNN